MNWNSSRRIVLSAILVISLFGTAHADGWNVKNQDQRLTGEELKVLLVGKSLVYTNGDKSVFKEDGSYEYHSKGKIYDWTYVFTDDGAVCITSPKGGARCDMIVKRDGHYISINEEGGRYQARVE